MTANCHFPVSSAEKLLKIAFKQEDLQAVCLLYETCNTYGRHRYSVLLDHSYFLELLHVGCKFLL